MGSTTIAYRPFLTLLKGFKWRGICYKGPIRNGEFKKYFADSFTVFRVRNNSKVLKKTVFFLTVTTSRKDLMTWKLLLIYIKSCFFIKPYFQWFLIKFFDEIRTLNFHKVCFYLLQWKPFENDGKRFLFYVKSFFRSGDIYILILTFLLCRKTAW